MESRKYARTCTIINIYLIKVTLEEHSYFTKVSSNQSGSWRQIYCSKEIHMICILHGFPCEMTSGEKSISHGKPYKIQFLTYFALQCTLIVLNTLRKVEDHENHVRWIYLTTVLNMGQSQKYARMYLAYTVRKHCR